MSAVLDAVHEFREAARLFSRPARFYLLAEFLMWTAQGIFGVIFNLYLVEAGFQESFVGRAISANAIGLALMALPAGFLAERWGRRRTLIAALGPRQRGQTREQGPKGQHREHTKLRLCLRFHPGNRSAEPFDARPALPKKVTRQFGNPGQVLVSCPLLLKGKRRKRPGHWMS